VPRDTLAVFFPVANHTAIAMQPFHVLCCFLLLAPVVSEQGCPIGKTMELFASLNAKIAAQAGEEAKAFNEYVEWCDGAAGNLRNEIKTGESKKEELEATINKCKADVEANSVKIEDLSASISADTAELKKAISIRRKEAAVFSASEGELLDAIETLGRAIGILQKEMSNNPASFAQVDTSNLDSVLKGLSAVISAAGFSNDDQVKLTALVQQSSQTDSDDDLLGAPAAAVYESHSSSIFDVIEGLKEKAEGQLSDLRKGEAAATHNYNMLRQSLEDSVEADSKDMDEEKSLKAGSEEAQAVAEGDREETSKELNKDKESLDTAKTTCMTVAADHEASTRSRSEEMTALNQAAKILADGYGAAWQTYCPNDSCGFSRPGGWTFLQLTSRTDLSKREVVSIVKKLAKSHHSAALAQLASRISSVMKFGGEDVFAKVKNLISEMLSKLEASAQAEASEKAYCDEELAKTDAKKGELEAVATRLTSKIDLAAAKSAELKGEEKVLQSELATIASEQSDMDRIRAEEKALFDKAKSDLTTGIAAIQKAIGVLKEYYSGAALVQSGASFDSFMQQPAAPQQHSPAAGAGGSIVSIMEVMESAFTKSLAARETEEADDAAVYEKTTQDNNLANTMKTQDVAYKTKEHKGLDKSIADLSGDRDNTNTELSAVLEYFGKIKERCLAKPETYEARRARREAEIDGLKNALQILESETAFMQHGKRSQHGHFLG